MKCRVIKPGFVRRQIGGRIKSVRVEPPEIIEIEGKIPAWAKALDEAPVAKVEGDAAKGPIPIVDNVPDSTEAPAAEAIGAELEQIKGVGPELRDALVAVNIDSLIKFVQAAKEDRAGLIGLPGISEKNVDTFIAHAVKLTK
jgi:predicted flap endonuclease-1-like 5' DNA nuclease